MPTPFDAVHVRLSEYDLEQIADGEVIVMTPDGDRDISIVVDSFVASLEENP